MARSLRDLIEFLLQEISLCGAQGASPENIVEFIDEYYTSPLRTTSNYVNKRTAQQDGGRTPKIDRPFKEKVWTWLTRNPEVSVGKDREGNSLSLSEVLGPDYVWPERAEAMPLADGNVETASTPVSYPAGVTAPESASAAKTGASIDSKPKHHVFVTEDRMWHAITGHGPDSSRVLPMEFALLSIIASQKGRGIIQPELVRLSGQDKRSVPKRTGSLSDKGYIEKRPIQYKSSRTSLCTLKKFVGRPSYLDGSFKTPAERGKDVKHKIGDVIDFKAFLESLFKCLKEYHVISRNDLKEKLGMADNWRWKILGRALRKLERIGCLKRLRAPSQYNMKSYHSSVMLIRDPTERDLQLFYENCKGILESDENDEGAEQGLEVEDETGPKARSKASQPSKAGSSAPKKENVEESGRIIPRWTPGRSMANMVFDIVDKAGSQGLTNHDIKTICFGHFFRRPLEAFLSRLVDCWQYSQPPHLRHLAVIRDTALRGTITHYVHYSYRNFQHLVDNSHASWEAVEYIPKGPKGKVSKVPAIDAVPRLDENGFPICNKVYNLLNGGNATLRECQEVIKPGDYYVSGSDPAVVRLADGTYGVHQGKRKSTDGPLERLGVPKSKSAKGIPVTSRKRKAPYNGPINGAEVLTPGDLTLANRPRRSESVGSRFEGMSHKEALIAKGYDESWTEYFVCVQERTRPGVYITPRGKRRAVKGRQGRPRISRIAVFKSEKLKELSWFTNPEELSVTEAGATGHEAMPEENDSSLPARRCATKRRKISHTTADSILPEPTTNDDGATVTVVGDEFHPTNEENAAVDDNLGIEVVNKRKRFEEVSRIANSVEADDEPQPKRKRGRPRKGSLQPPKSTEERDRASKDGKQTPKPAPGHNGKEVKTTTSTSARLANSSPNASQLPCVVIHTPTSPSPSTLQESAAPKSSATHTLVQNQEDIVTATNVDMGVGTIDSNSTNSTKLLSKHEEATPPPGPKTQVSHTSPSPVRAVSEITEENTGPSTAMTPGDIEVLDLISLTDGTPSQDATREGSLKQHTTSSNSEIIKDELAEETRTKRGLRQRKTRAGSVAFLRKKIVMDTLEKGGGIFPVGFELWYPFTTAWYKAGQTAKPDLRTIRSTVKTLADAGKLRQLTFSGKDNKGVMTTRTMITLPEIEPTDPRVLEMQKVMLSGDNYIPAGVEVDPALRKSRPALPPVNTNKGAWPAIDTSITVTLLQKPASIRTQELKKDLARQRRLNRASEAPERLQRLRLGRIGRPSPLRPRRSPKLSALGRLTTSKRPQAKTAYGFQRILNYGSQGAGIKSYRKRRLPISAMYPYSMLMCPVQSFHPATGTFLTGGCSPLQYVPAQAGFLPAGLAEAIEGRDMLGIQKYKEYDERSSVFFSRMDCIAKWETTIDAINYQTADWDFVNQTIQGLFESLPLEGPIHYDRDIPSVPHPRQDPKILVPTHFIPAPTPPDLYQYTSNFREPVRPVSALTDTSPVTTVPSTSKSPTAPRKRRKRPPTVTPASRRLSKLAEERESTKLEQDSIGALNRPVVARRNRFSKNLPAWVIQKMMTAIAVVRALAGGMEGKLVEWSIVTKLFPDYEPKFIYDRGKTIMKNNRLQVSKIQSDFQERFAEAYEKGTVPSIDYGKLKDYDWEWVVNWANTQLETPTVRKLPMLPATRKQFDSLFQIRKDPPHSINDIYQYNATVTLPRKRALVSGIPFALPLQESDEPPRKQQKSDRLVTAKTWVRANVLAPEETYDATAARQSLEHLFGETLVDSALRSLVSERSVSMWNRGRPGPGRSYDITDLFLSILGRRRALESKQLKRAAFFKVNILDEDMRTQGKHDLKYEAEDGDILVIINLLAEGRLELRPRDPPKNKYGLTDGGYLTRLMDKSRLRFGIDVFPIPDKYVYGNPVQEIIASVPAPRGDMDRSKAALSYEAPQPGAMAAPPPPSASAGKIPVWFDIHFRFIPVTWDLAIAAMIGTIAGRSGITTKGIASVVNPSLGEWEVELALEWMAKVGLVEKTRDSSETVEGKAPGWLVKEWWWLAIGA